MFEDFSERLFTHFVAGAWRVPYGTRALPVVLQDGRLAGQVIAAEARDVARVCKQMRGADAAAVARFSALISQAAEELAQALSQQGGVFTREHMQDLSVNVAGQAATAGQPSCLGVSARQNLAQFGQSLGRAIAHGVVYCPQPHDALFATRLACIAQTADLPAGAFNLLHGDHVQTQAIMERAMTKGAITMRAGVEGS
ncbi:hypothetical protein [Roseinatronobacter sp.]